MSYTAKQILNSLNRLSKPPEENPGEWLSSAEASVEFLKRSVQSKRLILYASLSSVWIHGVLAPLEKLDPPDMESLRHDTLFVDHSWAIEHVSGGGQPDRVYLGTPLRQSKTLEGGEKLIFMRSFAAGGTSLELSQRLVHALDLHYVEERSAYCKLDENGDFVDVITIHQESSDDDRYENLTLVTILAKEFSEYMRLAGMGLAYFFDFTRVRWGAFSGWHGEERYERCFPDLYYDGGVMAGQGSFAAGRLVVRPTITIEQIVQEHMEARNPTKREYATFKAINSRDGQQIEVSCDPKGLANYFQPELMLPLEISPVFFSAEVLHRYKADPEKYELGERDIHCRGAWFLKTYDINAAGQVHTYLRYLAYLPYKEQLYWRSFNEWPKAPISKRAFTTDIMGEYYTEYDPLNSLKNKIKQLDEARPAWWQQRGQGLRDAVKYPATDSPTEWSDEILALDHLVNEGLQLKGLRTLATSLSRHLEKDWKQFKLLEECLLGKGLSEADACATIADLRAVRDYRNVLKGHPAIEKRREYEKKARKDHGTFRNHFTHLAANCDLALQRLVDALL